MVGRPPGRKAPHGWRRPVPYDPEARNLALRVLLILLAGGTLIAAFVWFVPTIFDDETRARYAIGTILVGLATCGLARIAVLEMRADAAEKPDRTSPQVTPDYAEVSPERKTREMRTPPLGQQVEDESEQAEPQLRMAGVDLRDAVLPGADLRDTEMTGADLRKTDLRGADLRGADLRGADLRGAALDEALLEGAVYDEATIWPALDSPPWHLGAVHANEIKQ